MQSFSIKRVLIVVVVVAAVAVLVNTLLDSKPLMFLASLKSGDKTSDNVVGKTGTSTVQAVGLKVSTTEVWETNFSEPYPLSWEEQPTAVQSGTFKIFLTNVHLGRYVADRPLPNSTNGQYTIKPGDEIFALQFRFKAVIDKKTCGQTSTIRRYLPEAGDLVSPTISGFSFSGCPSDTTLFNQEVLFAAVKESDREFIITNGGITPIFFKLTANADHTIRFEKIETPDKYKGKTIGIDTTQKNISPSYSAPGINWHPSTSTITVARGGILTARWDYLTGNKNSLVYFSLIKDGQQSFTGRESFSGKAGDGVATTTATFPPGNYLLTLVNPASSQKVPVIITGPEPMVSAKESTFTFDDYDSIIADGLCETLITVGAVDEYNYPMNNASISLQSSRGSADSITKDPDYPNDEGYFVITSKTIGTSTLTAVVNGMELPQKLLLKVLDPSANNCPSSVGGNGGYEGY